jgi:sulfonate transport system ATP-binding protein
MSVYTPVLLPSAALSVTVADKTFGAVAGRMAQPVLRNVQLSIAPRSFVVITGPSGCGKSTLLNIIAGLDSDYDGSVLFTPPSARLAFMFQTPRLLPWRTVAQNIALALPPGDPRVATIPDLLARVGLSGAETAYPERLSLGMQRRVAIARAFVMEPDILLMDEPFVSLDDPTAIGLRTLVLELWERHPTTVVFVTHDRTEAVRLATRIIRLSALGPDSATSLVADQAVQLSAAQRRDDVAVSAEQTRIFANP